MPWGYSDLEGVIAYTQQPLRVVLDFIVISAVIVALAMEYLLWGGSWW